MFGLDQPWHWAVVIIVVALLFGYKKLPDAARSVGRSLRIFKTELKTIGGEEQKPTAETRAVAAPSPRPALPPPAAAPAPRPAMPAAATPGNPAPATPPRPRPRPVTPEAGERRAAAG